jgi:aspartate/methionine/tyrosine aminotransferase
MNPMVSERLQQTAEYYFSEKQKQLNWLASQGIEIINLGIGNPDLPPPALMQQVLSEQTFQPQVHGYQNYRGDVRFRQAISNWYSLHYGVKVCPDTEVIPLMGSKEGIINISLSMLNPGDQVLVPNPGYPVYTIAAKLAEATPIQYNLNEENNFLPDFDELEKLELCQVKMMWVNYPHMPTGAVANLKLYEKIIAFGQKHNILICSDNAYSFILNSKPISILQVEGGMEWAVEVNSLSKSYNMAGWRVGMMAGNAKVIEQVTRLKSNTDSGMPLPVQLAAAAVLDLGNEWFTPLNDEYKKRRELVIRLASEIDCQVVGSQAGMFIWAKIPAYAADAESFSGEILRQTGVFLSPGHIFGSNGERFLRISLCANLDTLSKALEKVWTLDIFR